MTVDTEIRHVTKPGANLFLELGFAPDEANRLHVASGKHINDTRREMKQFVSRATADSVLVQAHGIPFRGPDTAILQ